MTKVYLYTFILFSCILQACAPKSQLNSQGIISPPAPVQGWIETTAIVRDIEQHTAFFIDVAGYEKVYSGETSPEILKAWGLPISASGFEALLREPGESRGYIRLIELSGVPHQIEARSSGTFIDTGGIMGLNVRVKGIQNVFEKIQATGWRPLSDPVTFSVDNFSVSEALFLGPDGLVLGLIERQKPALGPEWRMPTGKLSRPNNAFVITSDIEQASEYYKSELGWHSFLEDKADKAAATGMNIYGWPHKLVENVKRHVVWLHPDQAFDKREGTIALIKLEGVQGRDFSQRARPPNYGWVSLRTWSQSVDKTFGEGRSAFQIFPYGCVTLSVTHDLDGTQIEHFRPSQDCE